MRQIYTIIFCCALIFVSSQTNDVDSIKALLTKNTADSTRLRLLSNLSEVCSENDIAKYANEAVLMGNKMLGSSNLSNAERKRTIKLLGTAYNNLGYYNGLKGNTTLSLDLFKQGLAMMERCHDTSGMASSFGNIAAIYYNQGKVEEALKNYNKCLTLRQMINDKFNIAPSLNNIGNIYDGQGQTEKALSYFEQSLKLCLEIKDRKGEAISLNDISSICIKNGQTDKALEYLTRCLKIQEEIGSKYDAAYTLESMGNLYKLLGKTKLAIETFNKSLDLRIELDDKQGISYSYNSLGTAYMEQKEYKKAENFALKSLEISKQIGYPRNVRNVAQLLYQIYKKENKAPEALKMFELYIKMQDSILNTETREASIKSQLQYEFAKKFIADSIKNVEEKNISATKIALQNSELKQQQTMRYVLVFGLILVGAFLIFFYNRFRVTRHQKNIIQTQSQITEKQRSELEIKNKNITESILVAKEIQYIIFPSEAELAKTFSQHFMFFKPCDILSGDFLWLKTVGQKTYLVLGDCTGHGVPASLLTMFANEFLNKIIIQQKINKANEILAMINEEIYNYVQRKQKNSKSLDEGMDIGLCIIDKEKNELTFCGAKTNLFYTNKQGELSIATGNKINLGKELITKESCIEHALTIAGIDTIYMTTDGLTDQLKYKTNKTKFGFKGFENFILKNASLTLADQKNEMQKVFEEIVLQHAQIDDVLVFAGKISG